MYKLCGHAYKSGAIKIYLVKDMFFKECEDSNNEICREIVEWADGKYYKRWKYGWLKKLERDIHKLKRKIKEMKRIKMKLEKIMMK